MNLRHQDRILIERNGEEIEIFNHVTVQQEHYVNAINGYETFDGPVIAGDSPYSDPPKAVTERVADLLWAEFGIDVEEQGIEVINPESDDVTVL